jgi:hypothetical protein
MNKRGSTASSPGWTLRPDGAGHCAQSAWKAGEWADSLFSGRVRLHSELVMLTERGRCCSASGWGCKWTSVCGCAEMRMRLYMTLSRWGHRVHRGWGWTASRKGVITDTYIGREETGWLYRPLRWNVRDGNYNERGWACTPPSAPAWANFSIIMEKCARKQRLPVCKVLSGRPSREREKLKNMQVTLDETINKYSNTFHEIYAKIWKTSA